MEAEKFWAKVDKSGDCWVWVGARYPSGYGRCYIGRKDWLAHRYAMVLSGHDVRDVLVCHTCDNPPCVRPSHLFLGSAIDNMQDMVGKGRSRSRLTIQQVKEIQRNPAGLHPEALAERYAVSRDVIDKVAAGASFRRQRKAVIDDEFSIL